MALDRRAKLDPPAWRKRNLEQSLIGSSLCSRSDDNSAAETLTLQLPTNLCCRTLQLKDVISPGYTVLVLSFDYLSSIGDSLRGYCPTDTLYGSLSVP